MTTMEAIIYGRERVMQVTIDWDRVGRVLGIVVAALTIGSILVGAFWWLPNRLFSIERAIYTGISTARLEFLEGIHKVEERVAKIEGRLEVASAEEKRSADRIRKVRSKKINTLKLANVLASTYKGKVSFGTAGKINLKEGKISMRDLEWGSKVFILMKTTKAQVRTKSGTIKDTSLEDIKPGDPIAIGYKMSWTGKKKAKVILKKAE